MKIIFLTFYLFFFFFLSIFFVNRSQCVWPTILFNIPQNYFLHYFRISQYFLFFCISFRNLNHPHLVFLFHHYLIKWKRWINVECECLMSYFFSQWQIMSFSNWGRSFLGVVGWEGVCVWGRKFNWGNQFLLLSCV